MATAPPSQVSQNYHQVCEDAINRQINLELHASYVYLSMAYYFDRDDVGLQNFTAFFLRQSREEREHAEKLLCLQNRRGGRFQLCDISKPDRDDWGSSLLALEHALHLELSVNQSLLDLHQLASDKGDPQLCHFLEAYFLHEQVIAIKQLGDYLTSLRSMEAQDPALADYCCNKFTMGDSDKEN